MKKITQLFPGVRNTTIMNTLEKHHIQIKEPEKTLFSNVNLVTGPNGAGKTRLLNALLELYRKMQGVEVIYGYFPALSCSRPQPQAANPGEDPPWEYTLREYQNLNDVFIHDLFKEIEAQSEVFLSQLRIHGSQNEKGINQRTFNQIAQLFSGFTGKELVLNQDLAVKDSNGVQVSLEEAMEWLSPGERMLFYMSVFFSLKRSGKRKWVIILDEPESHLHPKVLLGFIRTLTEYFPGATVWIATHSLFLLPEFAFENIVYMENGKVLRRSSDLYQKAMSGLLGEDNGNISRFFASLPHWQYYEFIAECFTNPTVVSTVNPEDEQVRIFIETMKRHEITRVLDCGGGSGRLGLSMMETTVAGWDNVTYDIYDAWPSYTGRKFKVYRQLEASPGKYDCVVMMNFLHEVPPQEWSSWFHKIHDLMVPDGHLLFVEVEALQAGECPNDTGYLVLGPDELRVLFDLPVDLPRIQIGEKPKAFGVLVAREDLLNVESETVTQAIQHLEERTYSELCRIRKAENKRRAGEKEQKKPPAKEEKNTALDARKYAFYSQQYINAKLFNDGEEKQPKSDKVQQTPLSMAVVPPEKENWLLFLLANVNTRLASAALPKDTQREAIIETFREAVNSYLLKGYISDKRMILCRDMIEAVEAISSNRRLIADLLQISSLLGDSVCAKRFKEEYSAAAF